MVVPMKIIKRICNLQRDFLWGGDQRNEMGVIFPGKYFLFQRRQGVGIRDPLIMGKTFETKTWWRWLKAQGEIWDLV